MALEIPKIPPPPAVPSAPPASSSQKSFLGSKVIVFFLGLVAVIGTHFYDISTAKSLATNALIAVSLDGATDEATIKKQGGSYLVTSGKEDATVRLFGSSIIRLAPETTLRITPTKSAADLALTSGRLWITTVDSADILKLSTGELHVTIEPGVYDIGYSEGKLVAQAYRHDLFVELLGRTLIIPEGRMMSLSEKKIIQLGSDLAKLHYSKLLKEFPFFALEEGDTWAAQNKEKDAELSREHDKMLRQNVRSRGARVALDGESLVTSISQGVQTTIAALTVNPEKRDERRIEALLDYYDTALYALLIGEERQAQNLLDRLSFDSTRIVNSDAGRELLYERLREIGSPLPTDAFFPARKALDALLDSTTLQNLRHGFNTVRDLAATGSDPETVQRTLALLRSFAATASQHVGEVPQTSGKELFFFGLVMNDFMTSHPYTLREEFIKLQDSIESRYLETITQKEEGLDERQFYMTQKLALVRQIRALMEKDKLPFQDARRAILALVLRIDALRPSFAETAFITYVDAQLTDLAPFVGFLRSTMAEQAHGNFAANFKDYQEQIDEAHSIASLLDTASGGTEISPFKREELAGIVSSDLDADFGNIQIALPESDVSSFVRITSAELEGKKLTALYDTDRKIFTEIIFDGQSVPNPVRVANLKKFLLIKMGKLTLQQGETIETLVEATSQESKIEKVAKSSLQEELTRLKISVDDEYIGLENFADGLIHVRLARLGMEPDVRVFSFDISSKLVDVTNLKIQTVKGEISVNDSFLLKELPSRVEQIYQRALFEKQREVELSKEPVK